VKTVALTHPYRSLVEGNVITIEPGCYVPSNNAFPKAFHGCGIRIEVREGDVGRLPSIADIDRLQDAIAFTKDGPFNLSANAPKEICDIEGVCLGVLDNRA
jgi:intermediate cleaving peptidase 55